MTDGSGPVSDSESCVACLSLQPFNLLRYELGQHYDSHYDAFDESYGPQPSQRVQTDAGAEFCSERAWGCLDLSSAQLIV